MTSFTAQIASWSEKAKRNTELVIKKSAQDLFEDAQTPRAKGGRMRVDTGELRNSFIAGLNGTSGLTGPDAYILAIANLKLGGVLFGGWTAPHARPREFGASGQQPDFFMRGAAQKWQSIVAENAAKLKD